jgi:glycosyltransferase involved in cell wall biosynthesis
MPTPTWKPTLKSHLAPPRRLKIGLWLAYHVTLGPTEGIGVFAHNLALGLANLPNAPAITIVTKAGDEEVVAPTVAQGKGNITVAALPKLEKVEHLVHRGTIRVAKTMSKIARLAKRVRRFTQRQTMGSILKSLVPMFLHRTRQGQQGKLLYVGLAVLLAPLVTALFVVNRLARILATEIEDLSGWLAERCQRRIDRLLTAFFQREDAIAEQCDLWLIPYVGLERKFPTATVVTIHDLVTYHFPEMLEPAVLAQAKRTIAKVAEQSTVVACMSNFIRDNDLHGQLQLPPEKVRVVKVATPQDFGTMATVEEANLPILDSQYVFYPSAFRLYKNHEALVRAVAIARAGNLPNLQLVFTGVAEPPAALQAVIRECGLENAVHILKTVERPVLALLYHKAMATIVPSLYEQGSFPIFEALHWQCPVACSDIPALREQFEPLGKSMLYFDPHDEYELARVIDKIAKHREVILTEQQVAKLILTQRTWTDAAGDWMEVFEYAIRMHRHQTGAAPYLRVA